MAMILPSRHAALSRNSLHLRRSRRTSGQKARIWRVHNAPRLPSAADLDALRLPAKCSFQARYRAPTLDLAKDLDCSISASMALLGWKTTVREFVKTTI